MGDQSISTILILFIAFFAGLGVMYWLNKSSEEKKFWKFIKLHDEAERKFGKDFKLAKNRFDSAQEKYAKYLGENHLHVVLCDNNHPMEIITDGHGNDMAMVLPNKEVVPLINVPEPKLVAQDPARQDEFVKYWESLSEEERATFADPKKMYERWFGDKPNSKKNEK